MSLTAAAQGSTASRNGRCGGLLCVASTLFQPGVNRCGCLPSQQCPQLSTFSGSEYVPATTQPVLGAESVAFLVPHPILAPAVNAIRVETLYLPPGRLQHPVVLQQRVVAMQAA